VRDSSLALCWTAGACSLVDLHTAPTTVFVASRWFLSCTAGSTMAQLVATPLLGQSTGRGRSGLVLPCTFAISLSLCKSGAMARFLCMLPLAVAVTSPCVSVRAQTGTCSSCSIQLRVELCIKRADSLI
jgi:hypothetical protein